MWAARGPRDVVIGLLNGNMLNHLHGGATWSRIALGTYIMLSSSWLVLVDHG